MRIIELFEADYESSIKNTLMDYLVSLVSAGPDKISVNKVLQFLRQTKRVFITRNQLEDILQDTNFSIQGNDIVMGREDDTEDMGDISGPPAAPEDVVGNMAKNQLAKGYK